MGGEGREEERYFLVKQVVECLHTSENGHLFEAKKQPYSSFLV